MKPDFLAAYAFTMKHEGGYVNDKDDPGGETYKGISRVYHPEWLGWKVVDQNKQLFGFPSNLNLALTIDIMVSDFYKLHYWDAVRGDDMPEHDLSAEMFDTGVNMGTKRSCLFLQQALNLLNRNCLFYPDVIEDGVIGADTLSAVRSLLARDTLFRLTTVMNLLQGNHYLEQMRKNKTNEKYVGWFDRVTIIKT